MKSGVIWRANFGIILILAILTTEASQACAENIVDLTTKYKGPDRISAAVGVLSQSQSSDSHRQQSLLVDSLRNGLVTRTEAYALISQISYENRRLLEDIFVEAIQAKDPLLSLNSLKHFFELLRSNPQPRRASAKRELRHLEALLYEVATWVEEFSRDGDRKDPRLNRIPEAYTIVRNLLRWFQKGNSKADLKGAEEITRSFATLIAIPLQGLRCVQADTGEPCRIARFDFPCDSEPRDPRLRVLPVRHLRPQNLCEKWRQNISRALVDLDQKFATLLQVRI